MAGFSDPNKRTGGYVKLQPVRPMPVSTAKPLAPRADFQTYYDPSRVVDIDRIKVVSDLRQSGTERGETQTGDNGILGPGSNGGGFAVREGMATSGPKIAAPVTENKLTPWLIAAAAYFILGG